MTDRLDVRTPDKNRLPPGQILTQKWPVLHYGAVPTFDAAVWRLKISGTVENPFELNWAEVSSLPREETLCDIHCVTRWSRYDNVFEGIPVRTLLDRARVKPEAKYVLVQAEHGFTTNVPLEDFSRPGNLLALKHNGRELDPEHGGPIRLLIPHLYFWKSAKWVRGLEFLEDDYPGFWEQNGYHMRGEPWAEERYGRADYARMRRGPRK
jgi:DMSO/TMAO reductase YedYZ molybdopterin-dependent catalytic subunit